MRIIFCGSGTFALPAFSALVKSSHEVVLAVTQPPRRAGRGKHTQHTDIAQAAIAAGVECCETANINAPEVVEKLCALNADVMIVVEFGQFIKSDARQSVSKACFNLHGSVLPQLRGAGPVNWAIINGMTSSGVSTFELVDKMDAGEVYRSAEVEIGPQETAGELREKLSALGVGVVLDTLDDISSGNVMLTRQDESQVTFAPKLSKVDGYIDFTQSAKQIHDRILGCTPWPGASMMFVSAKGKTIRVMIDHCEVDDGEVTGQPGDIDPAGYVATGSGRLKIVSLKPAGKKVMDWKAFTNGHRVETGDRFEKIE